MTAPARLRMRGPVAILFVTVVIDLVGFGIVLPLLPGYAARFGVAETAIGALVGGFSLMQFIFAPRWGRLSDRIGRRPVLLIGLAGSALSYLLFAVAASFWVLLASRLLAGIMGATVNVAQAYLADVTPPAQRTRAMGLIGAAFGLGFVLGPTIAGLTVAWGTAAPGFVAAGISASAFLLAWFRLPETRIHHQDPAVPAIPVAWQRLVGPYAVMFFLVTGFAVMHVVFPLYSERTLGYSTRTTANLFVVAGLVSVVTQAWLVGLLSSRAGETALSVAGCLILAVGLVAMPFAAVPPVAAALRLPLLVLAVGTVALGSGLCVPSVTAYLSRTSPARDQGRVLGRLQGAGSMARIVGPILAGTLNDVGGVRLPFLVGAGLAVVAGGLALRAGGGGGDGEAA